MQEAPPCLPELCDRADALGAEHCCLEQLLCPWQCKCSADGRGAMLQERDIFYSGLDRAAALCHQDGITHMTSMDTADRILLTASHDGVVKAWK